MRAWLTGGWIKTTTVQVNKKKKNKKRRTKEIPFSLWNIESAGCVYASMLTPRVDEANSSSAFCSKTQQHVQALTKEAITKASQSLDLNQLV